MASLGVQKNPAFDWTYYLISNRIEPFCSEFSGYDDAKRDLKHKFENASDELKHKLSCSTKIVN